jgi:hypothetical protein
MRNSSYGELDVCYYSGSISNPEQWLQSDMCEPGFQYVTTANINNSMTEQVDEEECKEGGCEEEGNSDHVNHSMAVTVLTFFLHSQVKGV